jgi:hypothetical protein
MFVSLRLWEYFVVDVETALTTFEDYWLQTRVAIAGSPIAFLDLSSVCLNSRWKQKS